MINRGGVVEQLANRHSLNKVLLRTEHLISWVNNSYEVCVGILRRLKLR